MATRVCPDCETPTDENDCPSCGARTIRDRREAASVHDPLLGRTLDGRYRIDTLIGRGGMGAVYRGVQLATGQVVAIKVIRGDATDSHQAARRFHREVKIASLLAHPHTVRVFDFGESEDGHLFMVLEFLAGRTLGSVLGDGALPEIRAAKVLCEVAQSLAEAHERGLAHRDLKPDNVMLVDSFGDPDFVKVLDFGIAKLLTGSSDESSTTRTGAVVGTPQYMAPEQGRNAASITPAVDVYALGVMLFEALAGYRPYDAPSPLAVMMQHAQDPIPPFPPSCSASEHIRDLCRRMLSKDPERRPTAVEAAQTLKAISLGQPALPVPVATPSSHPTVTVNVRKASRWKGAALAALGLPLGALFVWLLVGRMATDDPAAPSPPAASAAVPAAVDTPASDVRPEPAPDAPAAGFVVRFESQPSGAGVFLGDRNLGTTPIDVRVEGEPGERTFSFRLDGYRDSDVVAFARPGVVVVANLLKKADAAAPRPKKTTQPEAPRYRPVD
jgi:serine/threonine-protein kinase